MRAASAGDFTLRERLWHLAYRSAWLAMNGYWYLWRPRTSGVYVMLWYRGRILLIQNSYKRYLSVPGGAIARGETPMDAAVRELREEVGIELRPGDLRAAGVVLGVHRRHVEDGNVFEFEFDEVPEPVVDRIEVVEAFFERPERALARALTPVLARYLRRRQEGTGTQV